MAKHDEIFDMIIKENEITWQSILYDLVKNEDMNPWDIDVSKLTNRYIEMVKKLKDHDFRISGKMVLAAAILLKLKGNRFLDEDMLEIDRIIASEEEMTEEEFYEDLSIDYHSDPNLTDAERHQLIPRMPQPRKRKVSIYDLMNALDQALEVRRRRILSQMPETEELFSAHERKGVDLTTAVRKVFSDIRGHYSSKSSQLKFSHIIPSDSRDDKIATFVPLLHLTNMRKIDIDQQEHLGDIDIFLQKQSAEKEVDKELGLS